MKNPEKLIGKKIRGFKFKKSKPCGYNDIMDKFIGKIGVIYYYFEYNNSFLVKFEDCNNWSYPADQIEAHLVEEENETPTFTKEEVLDLLYKRDLYLLNRDEYLELVLPEYWLNSIKTPTKEEQLTEILGSSEKVSEIMELFKN